ncbi:MAG: HEPN domain-containing protein [Candidatus Altiarchaeia archaeon]|jgi:HEPN domain-containing protein
MKAEAAIWLSKAEEDLDAARYNLAGCKYNVCVFLSQQAAEKALKALLIKKEGDLIRAHDLVLLARRLNAPKNILESSKELAPAYTYSRYPDMPEIKDIDIKSKIFIDYAEGIIKWVKKQLS